MTLVDAPPTGGDSERLSSLFRVLSPKQLASVMWASRRKIALWVGAVSAGKTVSSLIAFHFALLDAPPGELVVVIGKTLQSIEDNVINTLQNPKVFGPLAAHTIHTRGSSYAVILGRRVELIGANNARAEERIRGATYALAYVDEATLLPPNFWAMLLTRLRVPGARLLATTNPGSRNHWLRTDYITRADAVNMIVFHLTMRDNPSLEPAYIQDMHRTYADPILHARFILGLWTQAQGAVFSQFDTTVKPITDHTAHVIPWEDTPRLSRIFGVGMDWGTVNASTGLVLGLTAETQTIVQQGRTVQADRPRLVLLDEWRYDSRAKVDADGRPTVFPELSPDQLVTKYRAWYGGERGAWETAGHEPRPSLHVPAAHVVDPAARAFRVALRNQGIQSQPAVNDVERGIATMNNLIGSHHLLVTTRCPGFLSEVTEYVWDHKKADEGVEYPVTENDHSLDGARYIIQTTRSLWWPILQRAYLLAA